MKPLTIILLMGAAAIAGGLLVRYTDHPAIVNASRSMPPTVVAPPVAPAPTKIDAPADPATLRVHVGQTPNPAATTPKPSAMSEPDRHKAIPEVAQARPKPQAEPPVVIAQERPPVLQPRPVTGPVPAKLRPDPAPDTPIVGPGPIRVNQPEGPLHFNDQTPIESKPSPAPNRVTLMPGTVLSVRLDQGLSSDRNQQGDVFTGHLDRPLVIGGFVIAEVGAPVRGAVVDVRPPGHGPSSSVAEMTLQLRELWTSDGQHINVVTQPWRMVAPPFDPANPGFRATVNITNRDGQVGGADVVVNRPVQAVLRPQTNVPFRVIQAIEIVEQR